MEESQQHRGYFQISLRTVLEVVTVIAIALAWFVARDTEEPAVQPPPTRNFARYRLQTYDYQPGQRPLLILFDAETGECWSRNVSLSKWDPYTRPLAKQ